MITNDRMNRIAGQVAASGLAAAALIPSPNFIWATGLKKHLNERPTVLIIRADGTAAMIAAAFEMASVREAFPDIETFPYRDNPALWNEAFAEAGKRLGLTGKTIGVEPLHFRFLESSFLSKNIPDVRLVGAVDLFSTLRIRKTAEELDKIRRAARIAEAALEDTLPLIRPGIREIEISEALIGNMIRRGSEIELPFAPIIGSGPNSADPHAAVSEREVQSGEFLLIDWGARYGGYCSDLTRTFAVGEVSTEMARVYETVLAANRAAADSARPGVRAGDVDGAARDTIRDAGYGEYFTHRLGHGLGMECHEYPYMFAENNAALEPGMVFTDEPGIYLPGKFGVRIEDDLVVTETGCEALTRFPRELRVLWN